MENMNETNSIDPNSSTINLIEDLVPDIRKSSENVLENNQEMFYTTEDVEFMAGEGKYNLAFYTEGVETNVDYPGNPGFSFFPYYSELRTGASAHFETDITDISWGEEVWFLNPMAKYFPPTAANPYDLLVQLPMKELERMVTLVTEGVL